MQAVSFQGRHVATEQRMELWQVKNVTEFLALTKIQLLFRNKCPSGCCKTLFNIQSSEKLDFNSFCHFFVVKEKHIFGDPYFAFLFFLLMYTAHICFYLGLYVLKTMNS